MLVLAVVVDRYNAAAEIYVGANVAVPHIGKVGNRSLFADNGVLDLHKVAYFDPCHNMAAGSDVYERPDFCAVVNLRLIRLNAVQCHAVPYCTVLDKTVRTYHAVFADNGISPQDSTLQNLSACACLYVSSNGYSVGAEELHSVVHEPFDNGFSCGIVQLQQPLAVVCAHYNAVVGGNISVRSQTAADKYINRIGKIIFPL